MASGILGALYIYTSNRSVGIVFSRYGIPQELSAMQKYLLSVSSSIYNVYVLVLVV